MKKISKWIYENALFLLTLFLLAFIPLYPKLPLVDVKNTWVYVRIEDFIVLFVLLIFIYYYVKRKVSLSTPLTIPIFAFLILGGFATIHGVLLFFPTIANVFPNVALLSYIRHIEYMSVFFVAFAGMKRKEFLKVVIAVLSVIFITVCLYGLGQKYAQFPAFLTMNEEFAKGIPITLSQLSRIPSTFAGHYDFAAYLVLLVPLFAALVFGVRNLILKLFFAGTVFLGLMLMFMTVSRVSFFAVLVSIAFVMFILKRKLLLYSIPIVFVLCILVALTQSSLFARFGNTVREVDVLVNGENGAAVGNVEYVPVSYLYEKDVKVQRIDEEDRLDQIVRGNSQETATSGAVRTVLPYELLPKNALVPLVNASNISTGETLPQGTGYINLSLSPVETRVGDFYYEVSPTISKNVVVNFHGNFLIKKASAYDLSFTTRFQGEWPNALAAFTKNIFLGSGYGSVSLAIDNNFLRMLAEIGILGTASFILLFIILGIYAYKSYRYMDSKIAKTFVVGVCAGIIGLSLNATLIDVFEASKVAFTLWLLMGITLAVLVQESTKKINIKSELISFAVSPFAVVSYLGAICIFLYTPIINQFFTLKDFNVFYHSVTCGMVSMCFSANSVADYIMGVQGVEPPLLSLYFYLMYKYFWLNQVVYHIVSIILNLLMALLVFMSVRKQTGKTVFASFAGFIFLISASTFQYSSSIGQMGIMASSLFAFVSFILYTQWEKNKNVVLCILAVFSAIISLFFGNVGVVIPLLIVSYSLLVRKDKLYILKSLSFWTVSLPSVVFIIGQIIGLFAQKSLSVGEMLGTMWILFVNTVTSIPVVILGESLQGTTLRLYGLPLPVQIVLSCILVTLLIAAIYMCAKNKFHNNDVSRLLIFLFAFFVLAQLPFSLQKNIYNQSVYFSIVASSILIAFVFYGLYLYLRNRGIMIAVGFIGVCIITYSLFQIIQIQGAYKYNHTSSESVKKFLVSIDSLYSNSWATGKVNFYFLNTPSDFSQTTQSQSSLESVLWFVYKNPQLAVHVLNDVEQARMYANKNENSHIFMFNDDRTITKVSKIAAENP